MSEQPSLLGALLLVTHLAVATGATGASASTSAGDAAGTVERIEAHVEAGLRDNRVPGGALAIVDERGEVHLRGFGVTGRGGEVSPDTPFIIGSVTKTMTALAVLQLVEDGSVGLDEPVSRYLDGFSVQPSERTDEVTVRRLLEHTSGLSALAGAPATTWLRDLPIAETAQQVVGAELASEPGASWVYTNANYVLLGAIVEEVTGRPYADHLEERLFSPLGMTRSTARFDEARGWGLGHGHRYLFGVPVAHTTHREGLVPAGLVVSTAHDLARYLQALRHGGELDGERILSEAGVDALLTPAAEATVGPWAKAHDAAYGLGWFVGGAPFGGRSVAFHPGASPDFGALVALDPATGSGLALLVNVGPRVAIPGAAGDIDRIGAGAVSLLTGSEPADAGTVVEAYRLVTPVLALVLLLVGWFAVRRPPEGRRARHRVVAATTALAALAILVLPMLGLGWRQIWLWAPDLTLVAGLVGGALTVAAARRLAALRCRPPVTDPPAPAADAPATRTPAPHVSGR
jgi:CubicO group peptidase (beta-lactamase class C family)